jgi:cytochrome b6-f complex iron-sulfur subunit
MPDQNEGKAAQPGAAPTPPAAAPPKPAAKAKKPEINPEAEVNLQRRRMTWAMVWGYLGINLLLFLRFFFPRALYEPNPIFSIGYPADFDLGIDQRFLMTNRVWVVKEPGRLFVIFARCTHLGCTPEWKSAEVSVSWQRLRQRRRKF